MATEITEGGQSTGTHSGEYRGYAATGERFTVRNVQIMRVAEGRMAERWRSTDELGILQQLIST